MCQGIKAGISNGYINDTCAWTPNKEYFELTICNQLLIDPLADIIWMTYALLQCSLIYCILGYEAWVSWLRHPGLGTLATSNPGIQAKGGNTVNSDPWGAQSAGTL